MLLICPSVLEPGVSLLTPGFHHRRERIRGHAKNRCPLGGLEAAPGFEPGNNGFADRCLSHLAMPPLKKKNGAGERI